MKFELKDFNRNVPDKDLLNDLKDIAQKLEVNKLSSRQYEANGGKYTSGTIARRFNSWNNALEKAGLSIVLWRNVSKEELFENLENVWIRLGRQPVYRDMKMPISKYSADQYITKFGGWRKALEEFVEFINTESNHLEEIEDEVIKKKEVEYRHKTKRLPSERLKVQVLMRDGNICRLCGVTLTGDNIHFDHIIPWSKGGETELGNLQILCAKHNLAKGNTE